MPGIPVEFYYPILSGFLFILVVVFVPKEKYAPLFWTSLVWGYFVSIAFAILFGTFFGLFHYVRVKPFVFLGSPLWLNVGWLAAIMLYLRFLPTRDVWYVFPVYLTVFSFASVTVDTILNQCGMLIYTGWRPVYRFILAFIWFYCAAKTQWVLEKKKLVQNTNEAR